MKKLTEAQKQILISSLDFAMDYEYNFDTEDTESDLAAVQKFIKEMETSETGEEIENMILSFMPEIEYVKVEGTWSDSPSQDRGTPLEDKKKVVYYIQKNIFENRIQKRKESLEARGLDSCNLSLMLYADYAFEKNSTNKILKSRGFIEDILDSYCEIKKEEPETEHKKVESVVYTIKNVNTGNYIYRNGNYLAYSRNRKGKSTFDLRTFAEENLIQMEKMRLGEIAWLEKNDSENTLLPVMKNMKLEIIEERK